MEFQDIVMQRYATKQFDGRMVPQEKINTLFHMIRFAPSGLNLQPWKIKVITDGLLKEELLPATFNQSQITSCSHLLVFCANRQVDALITKVDQMMQEAGVPDEMRNRSIDVANGLIGNLAPEAKLEWAKGQVYLALANAINGAKSLGFDSCPMGGFIPAEYSRILKLPEHLVPTVLCALGYAADQPMPKMRFAKEDIFF